MTRLLRIKNLILTAVAVATCGLACNKGQPDPQEPVGPTKSVGYAEEPMEKTLKTCAYYGIPDAVLGVGVMAIIPNPLTPIIALGYVGGHYYTCYLFRQKDLPHEVDLTPAIEAAKRETARELKEDFAHIKAKLDARMVEPAAASNSRIEAKFQELKKQLIESGAKEREAIEKAANRILYELYQQLDAVRNSEVKIRTEERDEYVPNHPAQLPEK